MDNNTEKGLKVLIIGLMLSILDGFLTLSANNLKGIGSLVLNGLSEILGPISFILFIIGIILLFIGRKEFGDKHKKFVTWSLILFLTSIIIAVFLVIYIVFSIFSAASSVSTLNGDIDTNFIKDLFFNIILITVITGIIDATYHLLIVHQLENKKGKTILYAAFIVTIITILSVAIIVGPIVDELIDEVNDETNEPDSVIWGEDYSSSQPGAMESDTSTQKGIERFNTQLNVVSSLGIFGQTLFLFAFFIAYKRIKNGELVPALPSHLKRCMNCGRVVQSDHIICAYCGYQFNNFSTSRQQNKW
jgi:uncharacterized membrane protein YozB (DUF420 family)